MPAVLAGELGGGLGFALCGVGDWLKAEHCLTTHVSPAQLRRHELAFREDEVARAVLLSQFQRRVDPVSLAAWDHYGVYPSRHARCRKDEKARGNRAENGEKHRERQQCPPCSP